MHELIEKVLDLKTTDIKRQVDKRLSEFKALNKKGNREWFSELCFCLLTANTSAELGIRIQNEFGYKGFTNNKTEQELAKKLKKAKYRFYNKRAHYIFLANKYKNIKDILKKQGNKIEWLVQNIKGMGYKEASHFLRNVGFFDVVILDKHIQNLMVEHNLIGERPKSWNKKKYEDISKKFNTITGEIGMPPGELDLYMWFLKTGKVLK